MAHGPWRNRQEEFARFTEWLKTDPDERKPKTLYELAKELDVSRQTLHAWQHTILGETTEIEDVDAKGMDDPENFRKFVYQQAMSGKNVQYARLWAEMSGLVKKTENVKLELSADQIHNIVFRGKKSGVDGSGVGEVQGRRDLLREPLRDDQGSGEGSDPLSDVAPPDISPEDAQDS